MVNCKLPPVKSALKLYNLVLSVAERIITAGLKNAQKVLFTIYNSPFTIYHFFNLVPTQSVGTVWERGTGEIL